MKEKTECRLCDGDVERVFELKPSPVANNFSLMPDEGAERFPLELMACKSCGHVQQRYVIQDLFEDYKYQTPQTVASYLAPLAKRIADLYPRGRVLEIGCNNGVFLDCLIAEGLEANGVDPAASHPRGLRAFFTEELAKSFGRYDVVVGNNVFAHIDELQDVFRGIVRVLEPDGVLIFESQYLVDLIAAGAFDMIYHEHLDYHTLGPLKAFLRRFGLRMTKWEHIRQHGGSIRVWAAKVGDECDTPEEPLDWAGLKGKIEFSRIKLTAILKSCGSVAAFGASAKATTLINELDIARYISFVADDTPHKQYRYIPGTNIQIMPVSHLKDEPVLLTAWNFEREIAQKIPNKLINPFR